MEKKRIGVLHAQVPFVKGGAELLVQTLVSQLRQRGYQAESISMPYKWYPEDSLYNSMLGWRLTNLTESSGMKLDMVIAMKFPTYGAQHPNKVCWLMHQYRQVYDLYHKPQGLGGDPCGESIRSHVEEYDRIALSEARAIYSISKNVSARLMTYNALASKPLYHPPPLFGRYQSAGYGDYVLSVGRLDQLKRNSLLISALPHCDRGLRVKIAGRGPEMEPLQKLAHSLGVADRVDFLGFVPDEDLIGLYANAMAVFFAPVDEDYGYITLEAFLSKRPVVTCHDAGGVLEFVTDGENGTVCDPDAEAMGEALQALWLSRHALPELGENGYDRVKDITWDNVIDTLTKTIR